MINIPHDYSELAAAQREGKLVVFAGAGVSIPTPSKMLDSDRLRYAIDRQVKEYSFGPDKIDFGANQSLEKYCTRLKLAGVPIEELVRWLLSNPLAKPNELHYSILRLFDGPGKVKIITTNIDNLFYPASKTIFPSTAYREPMVFCVYDEEIPNPFGAVLHLNGCISKPNMPILVARLSHETTAKSEGWPGKKIDSIYRSNTVLYIGYSHKDSIFNRYAKIISRTFSSTGFAKIRARFQTSCCPLAMTLRLAYGILQDKSLLSLDCPE